jgi:hypothetical protein
LRTVLPSNPVLAISEHHRCGLILTNAHYAVFAGPGAAIGMSGELEFEEVVMIGEPQLVCISQHPARQRAYNSRIQWMRWLQRITSHPDAWQRTEKLLASFEAFFSPRIVASLPDTVLAQLIGVLPQTVQMVRDHNPISVTDISSFGSPAIGSTIQRCCFQEWLQSYRAMLLDESPQTPVEGTPERILVQGQFQDKALVRAS